MRARTEQEEVLRNALARCASELRLAAWNGMYRSADGPPRPSGLGPPEWAQHAAAAFDAMDVAGQDLAHFTSCRELRPWTGEALL